MARRSAVYMDPRALQPGIFRLPNPFSSPQLPVPPTRSWRILRKTCPRSILRSTATLSEFSRYLVFRRRSPSCHHSLDGLAASVDGTPFFADGGSSSAEGSPQNAPPSLPDFGSLPPQTYLFPPVPDINNSATSSVADMAASFYSGSESECQRASDSQTLANRDDYSFE